MVSWFLFAFDLGYVRCSTNRRHTKETMSQYFFLETVRGHGKDTHERKWMKIVISKKKKERKKRKSERGKRYIIFVFLIRWSWDLVLSGSCSLEVVQGCCLLLCPINLLDPQLFFLVLAHPVYKMRIIQGQNTIELWNKLHFEEEKT